MPVCEVAGEVAYSRIGHPFGPDAARGRVARDGGGCVSRRCGPRRRGASEVLSLFLAEVSALPPVSAMATVTSSLPCLPQSFLRQEGVADEQFQRESFGASWRRLVEVTLFAQQAGVKRAGFVGGPIR